MMNWKRISGFMMGVLAWTATAGAGEPLSIGALLGPRSDEIILRTVPAAIDMAQKACQATAKAVGVTPVKVADLPDSVRGELEELFPKKVLDEADLYFGIPLNDPSMGIGFINTLGMIAAGGGTVMGMTFGNEVYMAGARDGLTASPEMRDTLAHELVHVAQYQALGFAEYKEMYAKETAREEAYEKNALELEAFLFEKYYPHKADRGFFSFCHTDAEPQLRLTASGGDALVPLDEAPAVKTAEVDIRGMHEVLARPVKLALGDSGDLPPGASAPQIIDPLGGQPLYVFQLAGPARLISNETVASDGPRIVALATETGAEVAWRTVEGWKSQRLGPEARVEDIDNDGILEVVEPRPSGARTVLRWTGTGFQRP